MTTQAFSLARFIADGATVGGPLTLPGPPTLALQAADKAYVDGKVGGIADAPNDGTLYGRKSLAWSQVPPSPITADAPSDSFLYARRNAAWSAFAPGIADAPASGGPYGRQANAWVTITAAGGASVTVADTAPSSPHAGDLWFDSVSAQLYLYFNDGTSSQWVVAVNPPSSQILTVQRSQFPYPTVTANGATTLDWTQGEVQKISLAANATIAVANWPSSAYLAKLVLDIQNQGAFNVTGWPAGTKWAGGTAPTITSGAGKQDVVVLMTLDAGTTVLGSVVGQDYR